MKNKSLYISRFLVLVSAFIIASCSLQDDAAEEEAYAKIAPNITSSEVPYPKLSDYGFFEGPLKNLKPAYRVLPFRPASELFSDYAHKKRFVWMPPGTGATYAGDDNALIFPVGAILIKNFYYTTVQPGNTVKIIETRLLVKTAEATPSDSGWSLYNYIWNEEQTEAMLDVSGNGGMVPITFVENGITKSTTYRIPSSSQCNTCHKRIIGGSELVEPIGVKPQNLNFTINYSDNSLVMRNQLKMWQDKGYISGTMPTSINSMVDWKDASKSLDLRARSYLDINCAHCHMENAHCDYVAMRLNFSNPDPALLGICMDQLDVLPGMPYVIKAGDANKSALIGRVSSTQESVMMPIMGRTLVHEEGVDMLRDWINSLEPVCE